MDRIIKTIEKTKNIFYQYNDKLPIGIENYYLEILKGINIEHYEEMYGISKNELIKYARICRMKALYQDLCDIIDILKSEAAYIEHDELDYYSSNMAELAEEISGYIEEVTPQDEETNNNNYSRNLIVYSYHINDSRDRALNAHSGREEQVQKSIANLIKQLRSADYLSLREKGYIHQNQVMGENKPLYINGNAFERVGRGSTKLNYIRISVSENNRRKIKETLNIDFDTIFLVVNYGDFKNEGMDEMNYYSKIYLDLKHHKDQILEIINIFKNDFTDETYKKAMELLTKGLKITDELTNINKKK